MQDLNAALVSEWVVNNTVKLDVQHILRDTEDAAFVVAVVLASPDALSVAAELKPMLGDSTSRHGIALPSAYDVHC